MRDLKNKELLSYVRSGYTVLDLVRLIKNRHNAYLNKES